MAHCLPPVLQINLHGISGSLRERFWMKVSYRQWLHRDPEGRHQPLPKDQFLPRARLDATHQARWQVWNGPSSATPDVWVLLTGSQSWGICFNFRWCWRVAQFWKADFSVESSLSLPISILPTLGASRPNLQFRERRAPEDPVGFLFLKCLCCERSKRVREECSEEAE